MPTPRNLDLDVLIAIKVFNAKWRKHLGPGATRKLYTPDGIGYAAPGMIDDDTCRPALDWTDYVRPYSSNDGEALTVVNEMIRHGYRFLLCHNTDWRARFSTSDHLPDMTIGATFAETVCQAAIAAIGDRVLPVLPAVAKAKEVEEQWA